MAGLKHCTLFRRLTRKVRFGMPESPLREICTLRNDATVADETNTFTEDEETLLIPDSDQSFSQQNEMQ